MSGPETAVGSRVATEEIVEAGPVAALAALFDAGSPAPVIGDELAPLWHWVALARWPVTSALGVDGQDASWPCRSPDGMPRRMLAGGEVVFHAPLRIGDPVRREHVVVSVTEKSGRRGPMVVAVVATRIHDLRGLLLVEERRDFVYLTAGSQVPAQAGSRPSVHRSAPVEPLSRIGSGAWDLTTDPTLLMRFSALTANPHRIHYDLPYARSEGYPALVVQGPLMTLALAELARSENRTDRVARMRHRTSRPLFCGDRGRLRLVGTGPDGSVDLALYGRDDTEPATTLRVTFGSSEPAVGDG